MAVKVTFNGRLKEDATVQTTSENYKYIYMQVAVNDRKGKNTYTTWMTINADYNQFKKALPYLKKGTCIMVNGDEHVNLYQRPDGTYAVTRQVMLNWFEFTPTITHSSSNTITTNEQVITCTQSSNDLPF